ncbi:magnesium/cobalt transporter CorA [Halobaculum sp. CBA1158]|uniref:magnesium/cobalt transporter CorA n=1 Tax=Halobaculum sp. CBA1158 TaxID=2904243 RepID=UPI001F15C820|nr:magnesium/cobalt transporter CorA [Halobaculum sp. CBA1158]UIP00018.1 magnesium/cobalt transporter CorA [Halobaculum sp. CBA1158]
MIRAMSYTDGEASTFDEPEPAVAAPGTTWVWIDVADADGSHDDRDADSDRVGDGSIGDSDRVGDETGRSGGPLHPTGDLAEVTDRFGIHPLHAEDVLGDARPKSELLEEYAFLLVKAAQFRVGETTFLEEIRTRPVGVFVGDDWLVTVTTDGGDAVEPVWERLAGAERRALARGPDFAGYLVVDRIVDGYFRLLEELEDDIETVEERVVEAPDPDTLPVINELRRELLSVRRVVWPTRDAMNALSRGDADHVAGETEKYYRDVYDHLVQLVELTETYRDLTAGARDIYLNTLSQSTNEVMRRLTVVATVVLPLTFVAGVFGMNFETMPELTWPYAYHATMLGMAGIAVVLVAYFRREGWL